MDRLPCCTHRPGPTWTVIKPDEALLDATPSPPDLSCVGYDILRVRYCLENQGACGHGTSSSFKNSGRPLWTACIHCGDAWPLRRISLGVQLHDILLSAALANA